MPQTGNSLVQYSPRLGVRGQATRVSRGFTLIEMLVVMGILVVLAGLAMVAVHAARGKAEQARMSADLQAISTALDAYKADFGDYPRVPEAPAVPHKFPGMANMGNVIGGMMNPQLISGAEVLCWALVGPYNTAPTADFNTAMASNPNSPNPMFPIPTPDGYTQTIVPGDGADGPGVRLSNTGRGQIYPSYLNVERFHIGRQPKYERYMVILDSQNWPILYFPTAPRRNGNNPVILVDRGSASFWDIRDNETAFWRMTDTDSAVPVYRMLVMLGDRGRVQGGTYQVNNPNGIIDGPETPPQTPPFLLWTAGPDQQFGPANPFEASDVNNCDDVTNIKY